MLIDENNVNDGLVEGENLEDNAYAEEEEHPLNFENAMDFKSPRKRCRDHYNSEDDMNNRSNSII